MCINAGYYYPWDSKSTDDLKAADDKTIFEYGFYADP